MGKSAVHSDHSLQEIAKKEQIIHQSEKLRRGAKFELPQTDNVTQSTIWETIAERNGDKRYSMVIIVFVVRNADMEAIAK